jgi:hypothetical protein
VTRLAEKLAGHFYEGPEPPERIAEMARVFASLHPRATRGEWLAMAEELAREAYRSGWVRGFEYAERDPEEPAVSPEVIADAHLPGWRDRAHDWSWETGLPAPGGLDLVPEDESPPNEVAQAFIDAIEAARDDDQKVPFGRGGI